MIRNIVPHVKALACFVAAFALMTAGSATAKSPEKRSDQNGSHAIAAADGAGWLLFKGHRSSRADRLAPSSVELARVADPEVPHTSAVDSMSRWGAVRAAISTR